MIQIKFGTTILLLREIAGAAGKRNKKNGRLLMIAADELASTAYADSADGFLHRLKQARDQLCLVRINRRMPIQDQKFLKGLGPDLAQIANCVTGMRDAINQLCT